MVNNSGSSQAVDAFPTAPKVGKARKLSRDRKRKAERAFPRVPLETAMKIPVSLKEKNGGNEWSPEEVAKAVGVSSKTPNFFYLVAASRDYGLTEGTRDSAKICLTPLGRAVVYPQSAEHGRAAKLQAFFNVQKFKSVLAHYKGNNLPEKEYVTNTLVTAFDIPPEHHDEFIEVFKQNCAYLGIASDFQIPQGGELTKVNGSGAGAAQTVTHSAPSKGTGPLCFVIMPFTEREAAHTKGFFKEVLDSLILPACGELGFIVKSANREGSDVIQSTIVNDLLEADLVVADLTEHNPNVLFELGMRMREDKPVVLIKAKGTGKIFDIDNMLRVYEYDPCLWLSSVKLDLVNIRNHVKATWENRERSLTFMKILRQAKGQVLQPIIA
jgi:hypothetical protein